jgi:hypothetical protein
MADPPRKDGLSPKASLTIALAGIAATLVAALASSWLTGHQQSTQQDKNLTKQVRATDTAELRGVADRAESALLHAEAGVNDEEDAQQRADGAPGGKRSTYLADLQKRAGVARRRIEAMPLAEARLTVRLGASDPITKAYHLSYIGLLHANQCAAHTPAPDYEGHTGWDEFVVKADDVFNAAVTRLLGSTVVTRPHLDSRADVNRLEAALAGWSKAVALNPRVCDIDFSG